MQASAVGVYTSDAFLPQRCDEPGKCRIFDLEGKQIGASATSSSPAPSPRASPRFRLKETDLQGYMDTRGNWVIEAQFKAGRSLLRKSCRRPARRWPLRHIDRSGKEVGGSYDAAEAFTEGRGLVSISKGGDTCYTAMSTFLASCYPCNLRGGSSILGRPCRGPGPQRQMGLYRSRRKARHRAAFWRSRPIPLRACHDSNEPRLGSQCRPHRRDRQVGDRGAFRVINQVGDAELWAPESPIRTIVAVASRLSGLSCLIAMGTRSPRVSSTSSEGWQRTSSIPAAPTNAASWTSLAGRSLLAISKMSNLR